MDCRRRARQIIDLVDLDIKRESNIVPNHFEMFMIEQMFDISTRASKEIVDAHGDVSIR